AGTVFLVSHSTRTIERLCDRAIWIDQGQLVLDGPSDAVVEQYREAMKRKLCLRSNAYGSLSSLSCTIPKTRGYATGRFQLWCLRATACCTQPRSPRSRERLRQGCGRSPCPEQRHEIA